MTKLDLFISPWAEAKSYMHKCKVIVRIHEKTIKCITDVETYLGHGTSEMIGDVLQETRDGIVIKKGTARAYSVCHENGMFIGQGKITGEWRIEAGDTWKLGPVRFE